MDNEKQLIDTDEVMTCRNCGHKAIQTEVDENEGKCPGCNEEFQPLGKSS